MTVVEQARALEELEQHVERVLDLFPWPADSPYGSEGGMVVRVLDQPRTPGQAAAEQRLRPLRGALKEVLVAINNYRQSG